MDPSSPCPRAEDFKDVHKGFYIIIRVTPSERHSLSDYIDAFKPDVKYAVVRHPAQQLAALGVAQPGEFFSRSMKNLERSVQFKAAIDEVLMFESFFFARHLAARKLEATGFTSAEVEHMWAGSRTPHDVSGFNMIFCKYCHHADVARRFKGRPHLTSEAPPVAARAGVPVKAAAVHAATTLDWNRAVFRDMEPTEEQRRQGNAMCPKLAALYRVRFPELTQPGAANQWGSVVPLFADMVTKHSRGNALVVVGAGTAAWREVTLNWMVAAHRLRIYNYVVLSLDEELHGVLTRANAPSFLPPDPAWAQAQEPLYRWRLVSEALHRGVNVLFTEPQAVLLRSPFGLLAAGRSHIIAGDARPPDHRAEPLAKAKGALTRGNNAASAAMMVEEGRLDPAFVWLKHSNHLMALLPKVVAGIAPKARDSPGRSFNHVLNGGAGGFVSWNNAPLQDPHLHSEQVLL